MRIAYLSTFYPYRGGIAQFNALLYRALAVRHEVQAFTFTRQYPGFLFPGRTQYVEAGDRADVIPAARVLDTLNPLSYWRAARRIRAAQPDVLLSKFWMPYFAPALGGVSARLRSRRTVAIAVLDNVMPHERRPGDVALVRYFLRRTDAFVVMSRPVEAELQQFAPGAPYVLQPHPLYDHFGPPMPRAAARAALGLPADRRLLLFFGFIRAYKGLDVAIRALPQLPQDVALVVAGECYGDFAPYQQLIDELGLGERVHLFVRYIDDSQVVQFFSAADAALLPYKSATQSGIAQIAYHFALPLIVTDVGGLGEMVQHEVTGLVVRGLEPEALSNAVLAFFASPGPARFVTAMQARRGMYSWTAFATAIEKLHDQVASVGWRNVHRDTGVGSVQELPR